jgi:hypothetical protein
VKAGNRRAEGRFRETEALGLLAQLHGPPNYAYDRAITHQEIKTEKACVWVDADAPMCLCVCVCEGRVPGTHG